MRKGLRILSVALAFATLGAVAWVVLRPPMPIYAGKPLRDWIKILNSISPGQDPPAAWQELGPDEFTVLVSALEFRDSRFHNLYPDVHRRLWRKLPVSILRRLPRPMNTEDIAINALMLLKVMGERERKYPIDARLAVPVLIHLVKTDKSSVIRFMAASDLGLFGERNEAVTLTLIQALKDESPTVRNTAAAALKRIDPEAARHAGVN